MGCGDKHKVHGIVKDFIENQMNQNDFDVLEWSDMKPTYFVTDSMLQVMRKSAETTMQVKADAKYVPQTDTLHFIHVKYLVEKDTIDQTFYLDGKLTGIVGFKSNQ